MKKLLLSLLLLPTLAFSGTKVINLTSSNSINFNDQFSPQFVAKKQLEAINKCYSNVGSTIYISLYTPGGSITAGQLFFDTLNALPCKFDTITIFSASMGYQTVQNLGKRYILPSGTLMSHRASLGGLSGELGGELDSIIAHYKKTVKEMETVASKRAGITLEQYQKDISDELWMTGAAAVKKRHADAVALIKCDKSLMGVTTRIVNTFFGSLRVGFSNCPIIVAPVSIRAANEGIIFKYKQLRKNMMKNTKTTL